MGEWIIDCIDVSKVFVNEKNVVKEWMDGCMGEWVDE